VDRARREPHAAPGGAEGDPSGRDDGGAPGDEARTEGAPHDRPGSPARHVRRRPRAAEGPLPRRDDVGRLPAGRAVRRDLGRRGAGRADPRHPHHEGAAREGRDATRSGRPRRATAYARTRSTAPR
jgi:hypothetical protein